MFKFISWLIENYGCLSYDWWGCLKWLSLLDRFFGTHFVFTKVCVKLNRDKIGETK